MRVSLNVVEFVEHLKENSFFDKSTSLKDALPHLLADRILTNLLCNNCNSESTFL